jgi:hypothetical protein
VVNIFYKHIKEPINEFLISNYLSLKMSTPILPSLTLIIDDSHLPPKTEAKSSESYQPTFQVLSAEFMKTQVGRYQYLMLSSPGLESEIRLQWRIFIRDRFPSDMAYLDVDVYSQVNEDTVVRATITMLDRFY